MLFACSRACRIELHVDGETVRPAVARYQSQSAPIQLSDDAAFALPRMYEFLETQGIEYAIRLPQIRSYKQSSAIW